MTTVTIVDSTDGQNIGRKFEYDPPAMPSIELEGHGVYTPHGVVTLGPKKLIFHNPNYVIECEA